MLNNVVFDPIKPDFDASFYPKPRLRTLNEFADGYRTWADNSGVAQELEGSLIRVVATNLKEIAKTPIPHGEFKGKPRFISEIVAKEIGVKPNPLPEEYNPLFSWARTSIQRAYATIAYHQGSSEYGSTQQQADLLKHGDLPPIFEEFLRSVMIEEGEHGFQMLAWLALEGGEQGLLFAEDLLARKANSKDRQLQQPLIEFNPMVQTLPEFAHYLDNQDRDGWSQLRNSRFNGSALYAGQMHFFLRQEARHMGAGERLIDWYLLARKIPMDLHLKMTWEWNAMSYRLHGNPYNSDGALTSYRLGIKNEIYPLDRKSRMPDFARIKEMHIPHREGKNGYKIIEVNESMNLKHLNGYSVSVLRNLLLMNNLKRSELLDKNQQKDMRDFLKKATEYVPDQQRSKIREAGIIPTAALSWRPEHLASVKDIESDPWYNMRGLYTDIFGNVIHNADEYKAYREKVALNKEDREKLRDITSKSDWIIDIKLDSKHNIYRYGVTKYNDEKDTQLFSFRVGKEPTNMKLFTVPQVFDIMKKEQNNEESKDIEETDGLEFLLSIHSDLVGRKN